MTRSWTVEHFSQANSRGLGQGDVPALLRRVADSIEELGPVEVQDLILHQEMTAEGPWFDLTVYFRPAEKNGRPPMTDRHLANTIRRRIRIG